MTDRMFYPQQSPTSTQSPHSPTSWISRYSRSQSEGYSVVSHANCQTTVHDRYHDLEVRTTYARACNMTYDL